MKGDTQFLLFVLIGSFLFVFIVCFLLLVPGAFLLAFYPQSLADTDITEIPFASWLPSSAVFVEGYRFNVLMDSTSYYKVTIPRSYLGRFMLHASGWEEGNLVVDEDDDWFESRWPELSMARKCYSYSTLTGYGLDTVTVCSDDTDVSTIYIKEEIW